MPRWLRFTVSGVEAVQRAMKALPGKVGKKVVRQAERKANKIFQSALKATVPVRTGKVKKSVRVRTSKGTRAFKRGQIAIATLVGEGGRSGDKAAGIVRPWWAFLQDHGYHVGGRRVRKKVGKSWKTTGYERLAGRRVKKIKGKHFVKRALRRKESQVMSMLKNEILDGIEREAAKG